MELETRPGSPVNIPGRLIMPYRYAAGVIGSRFFTELRDHRRIMGTKCPYCNRVYVPPRSSCVHCFRKLDEWVELPYTGTLQTYTVVNYSLPIHPLLVPFVYGIVLLDGASTGLTHFISEAQTEKLSIGMRVKAVFSEKRQASILDIAYFKPI